MDILGGPKVDKLAKEGTANIELPKTKFDNLDFSFSGIKTAVINLHHKNQNINKADLCASFEKTITEELIENTLRAAKQLNINKIALAGGVSANTYIRSEFLKLQKQGYEIYYPEPILCTDNAAMIASCRILPVFIRQNIRPRIKCNPQFINLSILGTVLKRQKTLFGDRLSIKDSK